MPRRATAAPPHDVLAAMADAYVAFLKGFPWGVPLAESGAREGLNKFIKNAYLGAFRGMKYRKAPLVTAAALKRLRKKPVRRLVFEHVVPTTLIQVECEQLARAGRLSKDHVLSWLRQYWVTATVTKEEDGHLSKVTMPADWDRRDPFARYRLAGLILIPNPEAVGGLPGYPDLPVDWVRERISVPMSR